MDSFDPILNWTLKRGSHLFPGQDGGTCINEAAIVAADFPYQPVYAVEDMPDCFSRPICALTMQLNDEASDEERQLLLPFVIRLACADTAEVEQQRNVYIASRLRYCRSFGEGIDILEGALAIGRRADELAPEQVGIRLDAVQRGAATAALASTLPALFHIGIGFVLFFNSNAELGSTSKTELTGFVAKIWSRNDAWKVLVGPGL